jgi:predicted ABC-type ATPase
MACQKSNGKRPPSVVVLAGPNGSGKSTVAPDLLQGTLAVTEYVNADTIAQGLSGFAPQGAALEAGKVMLRRLRELAARREDFAFETTLASRSFAPWLRELRRSGCAVHLAFLWLPSADFAVRRVAERVRAGGHGIPEDVIRRRYRGGLQNFFAMYQPLCADWRFLDNSHAGGPRLMAYGADLETHDVLDPETWALIRKAGAHAKS